MTEAERIAREALEAIAVSGFSRLFVACFAKDALARMDAAPVRPDDDTLPDIPGGVWIRCTGCGETAKMPVVAPGRVSIAGLDGWTCPPIRCPTCSDPDNVPEMEGAA